VRPISSPSPRALPLALLAGRSGADLRVAIDLSLQENAFLTSAALNAATSARLDELIGVADALDDNAINLAEIVGAVKGQTTAEALLDAWRGAANDLVGYAQGQRSNATTDLERRRGPLASALAIGDFSVAAADALVERRLQAQLGLADAIAAHDLTRSVQRLESLAASSDDLGHPLAAALAATRADLSPAATDGQEVDLRLHLVGSMQARVHLTGAALEAAADSRGAERQASLDAANRAAADVTTVLLEVYGSDPSGAVDDRLRRQTASFVAAADGGDRRQAASDVDRLRGEISEALASANPLLPAGLLSQQLRASDQPLLVAADAFVARDFRTAYARLREAARQSQKPADALALAIVDRYPGRYLVLPTPEPAD